MNFFPSLHRYRQIAVLVALLSLFSISVSAQDESEAGSPLEIRLTTQTVAPCIGSPLMLEMDVTNNGQKAVTISTARFWESFSFAYVPQTGRGWSGGISWPKQNRGRLILSPGDSYHTEYELGQTEFSFQSAGHYTLRTSLDHIYSNQVEFEVYDCGRPQEVKEQ